jgi:hypothetical protein
VIIPSFSTDEFVDLAMEYQLNLVRKSIFLALKAEV